MNPFLIITALWLSVITLAHADMPQADIHATVRNANLPAHVDITFSVPPAHHAYLDKGEEQMYIPITFDPANTLSSVGLKIEELSKPAGRYDEEVKATVLRDSGVFNLTLTGAQPPPEKVALGIKYQICNDVTHQCFRPQTTAVELLFTPATTPQASSPTTAENLTDTLLRLFEQYKNNVTVMFGLMFIAGLLSVATPCVYPMLPITSMFIVNRANGIAAKEKQHALIYVMGILCTYMLLGLVAGMTGGAFNVFMQSGWVNLAFAFFFTFFAIALLGYYELGFLQNEVHELDQHSARIKGLTGTWLMGLVAGLVISPCVGPIVFALLLQVADNIASKAAQLALLNETLSFADKLTISLQGSVMMAGFGLGVGVPFFAISVMKFNKLPKAGYWMNKIKYAFGLLILYFAYSYLNKAMGVFGVDPQTTFVLLLGTLGIWIAVVNFNVLSLLPHDAAPNHKFKHFMGVMMMLIGVWLVVVSLGHLPIFSAALRSAVADEISPVTQTEVENDAGIAWQRHFAIAQDMAQQTGKPIFIDFYASWCANCVAFKEETRNNPALNEALRTQAIALKLVDKEPDFEAFRNDPAHRQLKIGLPYFAIIRADGTLLWSSTNYQSADTIIAVLRAHQP